MDKYNGKKLLTVIQIKLTFIYLQIVACDISIKQSNFSLENRNLKDDIKA